MNQNIYNQNKINTKKANTAEYVEDTLDFVTDIVPDIIENSDKIADNVKTAEKTIGAIAEGIEDTDLAESIFDEIGDALDEDSIPIASVITIIGGVILAVVGVITGIIKLIKHIKNKKN